MTSKNKILESINSIHRTICAIGVGKRGSAKITTRGGGSYSFTYQKLDDLYDLVSPLLAAENIVCIPSLVDEKESIEQNGQSRMIRSKVTVDYTFTHLEDGSSIVVRSIGEDSDTGSKSTTKAMSAAHKTALKQMFMPPTQGSVTFEESENKMPANQNIQTVKPSHNVYEHDTQIKTVNTETKKAISNGQIKWLLDNIATVKMDIQKVFSHYQIQKIEDLSSANFEELRKTIVKRRELTNVKP